MTRFVKRRRERAYVLAWARAYETAGGYEVICYRLKANLLRQTRFLRRHGFRKFGPITQLLLERP